MVNLLGISLLIAAAIGSIALIQLVIAVFFRLIVVRHLRKIADNESVDQQLASVIIAVRGCDPSLKKCLIGILDQDYSNFHVHVVVDNRSDRAWSVVHEVRSEFDAENRMTIHEMNRPLQTCGLKCSAIAQGLEEVSAQSKYLVLLDADVIPHRSWLTAVTTPLTDPKVGVVTGNQWFEPSTTSPGALLRSLWNAGAIVPTAIYHNPWAGTCAMRMEDVHRAGLGQIWKNSVVDDGPIRQAIKPLKLNIHFEPSLIMVNREDCTVEYVQQYVARMLTWSKLYERTFACTVVHAFASNAVLVATLLIILVAGLTANGMAALIAVSGLCANIFLNTLAFGVVRSAIAAVCRFRGEDLGSLNWTRVIRSALLIPFAHLVYGRSCLTALFTHIVKWRQITYEVKSKSEVRMLHYRPLIAEPEHAASELSV